MGEGSPRNSMLRWMRRLDTLMMRMMMRMKRMMMGMVKRAHLMPELPWPHEDFARSSSNMLFHTARLTEDDDSDMVITDSDHDGNDGGNEGEITFCMELLTWVEAIGGEVGHIRQQGELWQPGHLQGCDEDCDDTNDVDEEYDDTNGVGNKSQRTKSQMII